MSDWIGRLAEEEWSRHVTLDHTVMLYSGADLPVYVPVTHAGSQAWLSPIYLIA